MGFFDYIKDMFSADCCDEAGELLSKVPLDRNDEYCIRYSNWIKTKKYGMMCQSIQEALAKNKDCPTKKDKAICVVNIPTLNGFTMHFDENRWQQDDFKYFFEYLSIVLMQDYGFQRHSSTQEKVKYTNRTEMVERYSLKNEAKTAEYDSILLRLCYTDNKVTSIKFCAYTNNKSSDFNAFLGKMASSPAAKKLIS